jgi:CRISPR system Cascade subunit CasA
MAVKNYGINYDGWRHPLTPYRLALKGDAASFPSNPSPAGLSGATGWG